MSQVKSKKRVTDHGEVFTSEKEVNAMLDLVKQETERIDSRFLEPACGNGNFLAEVLRRKLTVVEAKYKKSQLDYERYAIIAISSIFGLQVARVNTPPKGFGAKPTSSVILYENSLIILT